MAILREQREFFRQFRRQFQTTGSILPSSRFLARAMSAPIGKSRQLPDGSSRTLRVLEVGPGTGAVTNGIVRQLRPEDRFDLVEINSAFADLLKQRFETDRHWKPVAANATVHCCPLQEFRGEQGYDVIVSGMPFNNFPSALVAELLDQCLSLLAPGGRLCFFEYMFVRPVRRGLSRGPEAKRLQEIEDILQSRFAKYRFKRDWVFLNVPPAWVQHLQKST